MRNNQACHSNDDDDNDDDVNESGLEVIKCFFFMLKSAVHDIDPADTCYNANNC